MDSDFGSDIFGDEDRPAPPETAAPTAEEPAEPAKPRSRRRSSRSADSDADAPPAEPAADDRSEPEEERDAEQAAAPAKRKRRRSRKKPDDGEAPSEEAADPAPTEALPADAEDDAEATDATGGSDEAEDDDEAPSRKRKRRRRRSRRGESAERESAEPAERREPAPPPSRPSPKTRKQWVGPRTAFPTVPGQRLAVFVDLDALLEADPDRADDIAFTKLRAALTGKRNAIRTVAYGTPKVASTLRGPVHEAGFDVREVAGRAELSVALSVEAMSVGPRVDCIVIVPGTGELAPLSTALRTLGIRVESAGFGGGTENADGPFEGHHALGEECMFVP